MFPVKENKYTEGPHTGLMGSCKVHLMPLSLLTNSHTQQLLFSHGNLHHFYKTLIFAPFSLHEIPI